MTTYARRGFEYTIGNQTAGHQYTPTAVGLAGGGFMAVWQTLDTTQDGSGRAIKMQRLDANGLAVGSEILVNTSTTGDQRAPTITALQNGNVVVAWETSDISQDGSGFAIKARVFDPAGNPLSAEFAVNNQVTGDQLNPSITALQGGGFVINWQTSDTLQDGSGTAIKGRVFNASGIAQGNEFLVNTGAVGSEFSPEIASLSNGGFVASWTRNNGANADIYMQRFDAGGVKVGSQISVATAVQLNDDYSSIAQISGGRFVVVWQGSNSLTTFDTRIKAQVYSNDGTKIGGEFVVNTTNLDSNGGLLLGVREQQVIGLPDGGFLVSWTLGSGSAPGSSLRGQAYDANGVAAGSEATINSVSDRAENAIDIAVDGAGNMLALWESAPTNLSNYDIRGQIFSINPGPIISSNGGGEATSIAIPENTTAVTAVTASNPNGASSLTYSIVGGSDATRFTINASTGALGFVSARNFEARQDVGANNIYDVVVAVSDGTYTDLQAIAVTVQNVNEGQTFNSTSSPFNVSSGAGGDSFLLIENVTGTIAAFSATDLDGTPVAYSLTGLDAARFVINATTGVLTFVNSPNYEAPTDDGTNNIYNFSVVASDGMISTSRDVTIQILNENEGPYISSLGGGATGVTSAPENSTASIVQVQSIDPDNNRPATGVTYSIIGGADGALFGINANAGFLYFTGSGRNFEAPGDSNGDNVYNVIVQVSDGFATPDTQSISVTVTNVNEAPVITSNGGGISAAVAIAENTSAATIVTSTDPENTLRIYTISGGVDAALFSITASTGALSFVSAPNYEAPTDVGANNVYNVVVSAGDGLTTDTQALAITVYNVNEPLAITSGSSYSVAENTTSVGAVIAVDPEGVAPTYSITGGADAALFAVNTTTGALSFINAPDHEAPADAGADNVYNVTVRASDGVLSDTRALTVTVTDENEPVVITSNGGGNTATLSVTENSAAVTTVTSTDPENAPRIYAIAGGADAALFTVNAATGALSFVSAPNFEAPADAGANSIYDVIVSASDGVNIDTQALAISVTNTNEGLVFTSATSFGISENGLAIATVSATDIDGDSVTYAIAGGADAALFAVDATTGALSFISAANFEAPGDVGGNNVYDVVVSATDGSFTAASAIAVTVANVNEGVAITSGSGFGISENSTTVTTVTAFDIDGDAMSYAIAGGMDAALFAIDAATGALSFIAAPNFEAPGDVGGDNIYDVVVSASDGSFTATSAIAVTVSNVNEGVAITSGGAISVVENGTAVSTVSAFDIDGDAITYSISGGADSSLFSIDATSGVLSFISAPNFEAPADAGANNVYDVIIQASDGTLSDTKALAIAVTNANEGPVIIAGPTVAISENGIAVTTVTASDIDGDAVTYSIAGGADAALFTIDAATGVLNFASAPNFEAPADAGGDNVYELLVSASDGSLLDTQSLSITVGNINEAAAITSGGGGAVASVSIGENSTVVTVVTANDPENDAIAYAIAGGADATLFTINATTGALSFIAAPNFEAPADADLDNVCQVIVTASDSTTSDTQAIAITISNVNETLAITSNGGGNAAAVSVAENGTPVATVVAVDPESSVMTYAIGGGADAGRFTINAVTGLLSFVNAPNFEAPTDAGADNIYDVVVSATDGSFVDTQVIAVSVNNTNEAPVITSNGGGDTAAILVGENSTTVTTVASTDPEGTARTYSIVGGADAAKFTINATTGALAFIAAPNFEAPTDAGVNNVYDLVISATDGSFVDTQALVVTVTNINEAIAITSNGAGDTAAISINENVSAVTIVAASDIDNDAVSYSIAGGADGAKFSINATTGMLQFIAAPNFEAPTDVGANNVYDVIVAATDGLLTDTQAIAVTINNIVDGATITGTLGVDAISNTATSAQFRSTNAEDTINALAGADTISGGGGDDLINSGDGNDIIQYSGLAEGFDRVDGGAGTDTIVALANNTVIGLASLTGVEAISAGTLTGVSVSGSSAADVLSFAGLTLTGIAKIDGGAGNDIITASATAATLAGGAGDDTLTGGSGNDSFLFAGTTEGFDAITGGAGTDTIRANANNTIIGLRSLTTVEAISAGTLTGVSISGSSAADTLNFSSVTLTGITQIDGGAGNDVITGSAGTDTLVGGLGNDTLTGGNGVDTVDYSYSASNWTINLAATSAQAVSGTETDTIVTVENIIGSAGNDVITGSNASNSLKGGAGADRITGGLGNDALDGGLGIDVAVFAGLQASYSLTTLNGVVTVVDNQTNVDGNDGTDTLVGFEKVEFKGGVQVALALPIVLDLNGDGVTLIAQAASGARFDWDGDGTRDKTGWVSGDDGILFFDRDGNGTVSGADELSFVNDKAGAKSDLDGLSAFDSNGDGQFSSLDAKWSSFGIWQDRNGNGAADAGEVSSIANTGVASIGLAGQAVNRSWGWNDNLILNNGQFTRTDGSKGRLADVALNYRPDKPKVASVISAEVSREVAKLRSALGSTNSGLQQHLALAANVNPFDFFGRTDVNSTGRHLPAEKDLDITTSGFDARVNLMLQNMASFSGRQGEGGSRPRPEPATRYDYFA